MASKSKVRRSGIRTGSDVRSFGNFRISDMRPKYPLKKGMMVVVSGTENSGVIKQFDADGRLALIDGRWFYVKDLIPA